jgi:hypothetical protein
MYTFLAKGQPIMTGNRPMVLTKSQVEEWMERDFDNYKTDKRLDPARNKFAEEIKDQYIGGRSSKYMPQDKYLMSQPGYRRLVEAGLDKKPLKEQRAWAKKQVEQGAKWHSPATPVKDYSTEGAVKKTLAPGEEVVNQ